MELAHLRAELGAELSHLARLIRSEASRIERMLVRRVDRASRAQTEELTARLVRVQRTLLLADVATVAAMLVVARFLL